MPMLPSGLPDRVADEEDLVRFLTQSNQFNATGVKPAVFLPNPQDQNTSVSRHGREPRGGLWAIGHVAAGCRTLHGAAIFKAVTVRAAELEVVPDEPPQRHSVITDWAWDADPGLQKAKQKEAALLIAREAELLLVQ
jgi:hypothetical protein